MSEEQFCPVYPGGQIHTYEEFAIPVVVQVELFVQKLGLQTSFCVSIVDDEVEVDDAEVVLPFGDVEVFGVIRVVEVLVIDDVVNCGFDVVDIIVAEFGKDVGNAVNIVVDVSVDNSGLSVLVDVEVDVRELAKVHMVVGYVVLVLLENIVGFTVDAADLISAAGIAVVEVVVITGAVEVELLAVVEYENVAVVLVLISVIVLVSIAPKLEVVDAGILLVVEVEVVVNVG
jgi:hypothetical protein